jgi:hypothetical protein
MRSLSLVAAAAVTGAVFASPHVASADLVAVEKLPAAPPKAAPTSAPLLPDRIAATERADGLYPAILPLERRKAAEEQGYRYVLVFGSDAEAQDYATRGALPGAPAYDASAPRTCLGRGTSLLAHDEFSFRTKPFVRPKLSPTQIAQLMKQHRWPPPPVKPPPKPAVEKDTVYPILVEHLGAPGDTLDVATERALVDLQTLGTRLVSKSSETYARVAQGPSGIAVYAARAPGGEMHFLVLGPELPQPPSPAERKAQVSSLGGTALRLATTLPPGALTASGCGYVRFTLAAKAGTGEMGTIFANAFLPPAPDPAAAEAQEPSEAPAQATDDDGTDDSDDDSQIGGLGLSASGAANHTQRWRPLAVNVSVSEMTSEPSPLVSVTLGWADRDQRTAF